jgi:hypothetical protein
VLIVNDTAVCCASALHWSCFEMLLVMCDSCAIFGGLSSSDVIGFHYSDLVSLSDVVCICSATHLHMRVFVFGIISGCHNFAIIAAIFELLHQVT